MHDRDINAAKNILGLGYERLALGIITIIIDIVVGGCQPNEYVCSHYSIYK